MKKHTDPTELEDGWYRFEGTHPDELFYDITGVGCSMRHMVYVCDNEVEGIDRGFINLNKCEGTFIGPITQSSLEELIALREKKEKFCDYRPCPGAGENHWTTSCGQTWFLIRGTLEGNVQQFCFHCGKKIKVVENSE